MRSVATEHVYRVSSTGWVHCHGNDAQDVPAWPTLQHSDLVVLDLDDIFTDVWRFEGKSEYAAALIEKRARTQGLVEGAAHIVMHRLLKVPGGFLAFFSAIPLELWQRCTQWAREQGDHCLLLTAAGLLSHGVGTDGGRILLSQRRLMYFAQTEEGLSFGSMQALGGGSRPWLTQRRRCSADSRGCGRDLALTLWITASCGACSPRMSKPACMPSRRCWAMLPWCCSLRSSMLPARGY